MNQLTISKFNDLIYRVENTRHTHVGNLKFINGLWKFKALGYDQKGEVIPGGGPLTHKHNTLFATLDEALISATLLIDSTPNS